MLLQRAAKGGLTARRLGDIIGGRTTLHLLLDQIAPVFADERGIFKEHCGRLFAHSVELLLDGSLGLDAQVATATQEPRLVLWSQV